MKLLWVLVFLVGATAVAARRHARGLLPRQDRHTRMSEARRKARDDKTKYSGLFDDKLVADDAPDDDDESDPLRFGRRLQRERRPDRIGRNRHRPNDGTKYSGLFDHKLVADDAPDDDESDPLRFGKKLQSRYSRRRHHKIMFNDAPEDDEGPDPIRFDRSLKSGRRRHRIGIRHHRAMADDVPDDDENIAVVTVIIASWLMMFQMTMKVIHSDSVEDVSRSIVRLPTVVETTKAAIA
ncbi:unnamed protein product [Bursaphelenchus okinawaensis]|uniref:Uncharacterized protein n=1 Tax=Bursaphelenchus okinawaensis TaxID=465554 RepID=A0A811KPS7_9BILA|nr:unnamed protein product [Bursaphelenchus okinawaensis]CAG9107045.1 unnamed protein product [Bursaphelenchus okinawaensis]